MKRIFSSFFALFLTFSINSAYLESDDRVIIYKINKLNNCTTDFLAINYLPFPKSKVLNFIKNIDAKNFSIECKILLDEIILYIDKDFLETSEKITYQSKSNKFNINGLGNKYNEDKNISYSLSGVEDNLSYKINLIKLSNKTSAIYDESYLSYLHNNIIFTLGKQSMFWSPSSNSSLIISNNARPSFGFRIENNLPIQPKNNALQLFKNLKYSIFINKLEKQRDIPNALLFGNRISFNLTPALSISLLRTAQFGGKGRSINSELIKNLISGKDTTNRDLSFIDQPGNQLAGIDFIYSPKSENNISFYGQIIGEDGLDPIFDSGSFIKFPSKTFNMYGFSFYPNIISNSQISIEYIDTYSGKKNATYNHKLYKSGYRHYGKTIGAGIDADSSSFSFAIQGYKFRNFYKFSYSNNKINKNNNEKNYLSKFYIDYNEFKIENVKEINKKLSFEYSIIYRDIKHYNYAKKDANFRLIYKF